MKTKQKLSCFKHATKGLIIILALNFVIGPFFLDFGTPFGLLISKYKLDKYSKAVYGENIVPDGLPKYNIKNSGYYYKLRTNEGAVISELRYITTEHIITDTNLKFKMNLQSEIKAINNEMEKDIYLLNPSIFYAIDGNQDFSQNPLKRIDKLYLSPIVNTNVELTPEQSKEKFFDIISMIYMNLGSKYNFTSSHIIYIDINGMLETDISSEESRIPYKELQSKIKPIQPGEGDTEFINQLKAVKNGQLIKDKLEIPYKH
jgi:hypothetical protein